jgi:UDP-glucose 4-epimerase
MKILITGGDGFIGRACVESWSNSHDITSLDKKSGVDLCSDTYALEWSIADCDLVYHAASPVGIDLIDAHRDSFLNDMIKMNLKVFNLVKKHNKKIVFFSTSEVYKECQGAREDDDLTIGSPDVPRWGYASGKLTSEFLCKSLCPQSIIIRPFNISGRGDRKGVLSSFINCIKSGRDIVVHGDGSQTRAFCDVRDLVGFLNVVNTQKFQGQIYNVGNPKNCSSILELARLCKTLSGSSVDIRFADYTECFSKQHRDIQQRSPDCSKMEALYNLVYRLEDTILHML